MEAGHAVVCQGMPLGVTLMQPRAVRISKYLATYLRHAPHELGLTLQPGGGVPVDDGLAGTNG
jgi:RNA:NAD 2'-phosphotransferase (TPT1/KptA family)